MLASARRPAILIELGYSTNPEDGKLMSSPDGQAAPQIGSPTRSSRTCASTTAAPATRSAGGK
ncbi:MAG: N-acetylmuramoyl-L-alanine amidase [Gemmatimonadetes bacterium]|nr:N-acetylmuramoyl-L-alanine amidase [Gemmatimonadota bacterium]